MTHEEYLERNSKGFEGDNFVAKDVKKLIDSNNIDLVIELGSYLGFTAKRLATMAEQVITVEINEDSFGEVCKNIAELHNVYAINSSSIEALPNLLEANRDKNIFIYVDSHWLDYCPLQEELNIIARSGLKPVLAIHDWKVPNRPELGYDSYNGQDFTYEWIKVLLDSIYGVDGYRYYYNDEAEGAMRGLIYIEPLKNDVNSVVKLSVEEPKEDDSAFKIEGERLEVKGSGNAAGSIVTKISNDNVSYKIVSDIVRDNAIKNIANAKTHEINWDLVTNLLDMMRILKAINPQFTKEAAEREGITQYLK